MYSISEAAKALGVNPHTLRYYEKEGIITPDRSTIGVRSYKEFHIKWLRFIIKLRETKMSISDIKKYTQLFIEGNQTAEDRLALLVKHQENIQEQIETLISTNEMLTEKISSYREMLKDMKM